MLDLLMTLRLSLLLCGLFGSTEIKWFMSPNAVLILKSGIWWFVLRRTTKMLLCIVWFSNNKTLMLVGQRVHRMSIK